MFSANVGFGRELKEQSTPWTPARSSSLLSFGFTPMSQSTSVRFCFDGNGVSGVVCFVVPGDEDGVEGRVGVGG